MRVASRANPVPEHQADAVLTQANPVSGTKYTVLDTTKNVRIIGISATVIWAVTQPTPLEVHVTIDGQTLAYTIANPVSAGTYYAQNHIGNAPDNQLLTSPQLGDRRPFLLEGRSIKVEVEITWATTQPTPLVCRVKYAKW